VRQNAPTDVLVSKRDTTLNLGTGCWSTDVKNPYKHRLATGLVAGIKPDYLSGGVLTSQTAQTVSIYLSVTLQAKCSYLYGRLCNPEKSDNEKLMLFW